MIEISRMLPQEEPMVRALHNLCHPEMPERPPHWFDLNPTSVAVDAETGVVLAARSVTVDMNSHTMFLQGLMVHPDARGRGIGDRLFRWEVERGLEMGIRSFYSTTWAANTAMRAIFERNGFHHCITSPNYFPHGDGLVYVRHVHPEIPR